MGDTAVLTSRCASLDEAVVGDLLKFAEVLACTGCVFVVVTGVDGPDWEENRDSHPDFFDDLLSVLEER